MSNDNVALRFSFNILYTIKDGEKLITKFSLDQPVELILGDLRKRLTSMVQIFIRDRISGLDRELLNEKRSELSDFKTNEMQLKAEEYGVIIEEAQLRDLTFPKSIQELFAKHLEAKIRAKADLENARTAVATAKALKNASELMKGDENIKFFQVLETISKIADKGKHTFNIGDLLNFTKNEK